MKHIFVVDDEQNIRDLIKEYLEKEGFKVTTFFNGENVYDEVYRLSPDLLVLDIMMPKVDGIELCKKIRKVSDVPIIFVSAKDEELDRILALEIGGDDYMSKPFSVRELVIRIKKILKRKEKKEIKDEVIDFDDIKIYVDRKYIEGKGKQIDFTMKEYELIEYLTINKNRPFRRIDLVTKIWGDEELANERAIDDLVKRIRKKLEKENLKFEIKTVWGYGYKVGE